MNRKNNGHALMSVRQILAAAVLLMILAGYFVSMNMNARAEGGDNAALAASTAATPTDIPMATAKPDEPAPEFEIKIRPPVGWSSANAVQVKVLIEDVNDSGWKKIEVRIGSADWLDVSKQYLEEKVVLLELAENGRLTVRVTDKQGGYHSESAEIRCIDREPPTLTASIDGGRLRVSTADNLSGVAGIRVNGYLFANLQNGVLDMSMEELLSKSETLEIQAFDYAGNASTSVLLNNPYFTTPTPQPTATPTPAPTATKKPSSSGTKKKATATPAVTETPEPVPTATASPLPTTALMPSVSYMPYPYPTAVPSVSEGTAFAGQGNMQTLDLLYSANTNKQFISVQARNGETYYLIIDYDKPLDEDGDIYETYFLNLVDARDLFDVVSEDELPTATPIIITVTPEPTAVVVTEPPATEPPRASGTGGVDSTLMLLALAGIGGLGAAAFIYFRRKNEKDSDFDDGFEDDGDEIDDEGEYEEE